jgi:signal peptidase II
MQKHWAGLALTLAVVALDRVTKLWVDAKLNLYDTIPVLPGLFNIVHSENRGMAFGIGNDGATWYTRLILIGVSLAVLGALAYGVWQGKRASQQSPSKALESWALFLVAGGAIGNLYDRIVRGSVTDFLDIYVGTYHWPTFNISDCAITVGALVLVALALLGERKQGTVAV